MLKRILELEQQLYRANDRIDAFKIKSDEKNSQISSLKSKNACLNRKIESLESAISVHNSLNVGHIPQFKICHVFQFYVLYMSLIYSLKTKF